ncbi:MAG: hypothetical protein K6G23_02255, partial [Lachnospiraceae bacterium]|nr:hypothetical protein [Lachnospiraceae bacterium]
MNENNQDKIIIRDDSVREDIDPVSAEDEFAEEPETIADAPARQEREDSVHHAASSAHRTASASAQHRRRPSPQQHPQRSRAAYDDLDAPRPRKATASKKRRKKKRKKKLARMVTINIILLIVIALIALISLIKLGIWNIGIKIDTSDSENSTAFDTEPSDSIVALDATNLDAGRTNNDGDLNILCVGNAAFADDYGADDNLANIIQLKTGATNVYNAAITDSYMSATSDAYSSDQPMDGFSFYSIAQVIALGDTSRIDAACNDLSSVSSDITEAIEILTSIDYDTIDILCIDYDASDYLIQRSPYSDENASDIKTFSGALNAGVALIKEYRPDIRIIVMSPTYADYVAEDGSLQSSSRIDNVDFSLFVYTTHEMYVCLDNSITYVDNLYGTVHEDNASQYLIDHLHLNVAGREVMADRFIYALNRFNDYELTD